MANHEVPFYTCQPGEANLPLVAAKVPPLTPESFHPESSTEARDRIEATISEVQGRKRAAQLAEHFNLDLNPGGK